MAGSYGVLPQEPEQLICWKCKQPITEQNRHLSQLTYDLCTNCCGCNTKDIGGSST